MGVRVPKVIPQMEVAVVASRRTAEEEVVANKEEAIQAGEQEAVEGMVHQVQRAPGITLVQVVELTDRRIFRNSSWEQVQEVDLGAPIPMEVDAFPIRVMRIQAEVEVSSSYLRR